MITVHGRTRCQFYKGRADWRAIARVKQAVSSRWSPMATSPASRTRLAMLEQSGADAVMVGRGHYGAPWLAGEIAASGRRTAPGIPATRGRWPTMSRRTTATCCPSTVSRAACGRRASILAGISTATPRHGPGSAPRDSDGTDPEGRAALRAASRDTARVIIGERGMSQTAVKDFNPASIVLDTIRHPVIMVDADGHITFANTEAEDFFRTSAASLAKHTLDHYIPFGSPLIALVEQVRERRSPYNEYRVDISSPRLGPGARRRPLCLRCRNCPARSWSCSRNARWPTRSSAR
jgi:PAS domain-containing protein